MATKRKLSDLVRQEFELAEAASQASKATDSVAVAPVRASKTTQPQVINVGAVNDLNVRLTEFGANDISESVPDKVPRYLTLDRKEVRLRPDQVDGLNQLTKTLNRKRKGQGESLTDNTLIRVAVDLLLNQTDKIQGTTEVEIRDNLGLGSAIYGLPE